MLYFLTGIALESVIVVVATVLARPRGEIITKKDEEEHSSWFKFYVAVFSISFTLVLTDILYARYLSL